MVSGVRFKISRNRIIHQLIQRDFFEDVRFNQLQQDLK